MRNRKATPPPLRKNCLKKINQNQNLNINGPNVDLELRLRHKVVVGALEGVHLGPHLGVADPLEDVDEAPVDQVLVALVQEGDVLGVDAQVGHARRVARLLQRLPQLLEVLEHRHVRLRRDSG